MGLAKAAPSIAPVQSSPVNNVVPELPFQMDGVPIEVMRYFDVQVNELNEDVKGKLQDIYRIVGRGNKDMGDVLRELQQVDMHLGAGGYSRKFDKIWSYLKLSDRINDLEKQRESLRMG